MSSLPFLLLAVPLLSGAAVDSGEHDARLAAQVREESFLLWEATSVLDVEADEYFALEDGEPDPTKTTIRYRLVLTNDGRMRYESWMLKPDGRRVQTENVREDGKARITVGPGYPGLGTTATVQVDPQTARAGRYEGSMNALLWLLRPSKVPVHTLIDEGAVVREDRDAGGQRVVVLTVPYRDTQLRCTLDPERDWLVREVVAETPDEPRVFRVDAFEQKAGRWYPARGSYNAVTEDGLRWRKFRVNAIALDTLDPKTSFGMPPRTDGMDVSDNIRNTRYIVGKRRPVPTAAEVIPARTGSPILAEPRTVPWSTVGLIGALLAVVVTITIYIRTR
jgi:hypothetical protein